MLNRSTMFILLVAGSALAAESESARIAAATRVLKEMSSVENRGVPNDLFRKARCAVVIPDMKNGGFVVSARYGRGFASCRQPGGGWTSPAAIRIEGSGLGFQAGGQSIDIVMLVMTEKGMKGILASKFTIGADASVAAGPVGRDAAAQTDATLRADILSWSRSRGMFGGVALEGGTLRVDQDANKEIYGYKENASSILSGNVQPTAQTMALLNALSEVGGTERTR